MIVLTVAFSSCGENDTTDPIVTIESPGDASRFNVDNQIQLKARITDDLGLKQITLTSDLGLSSTITNFDTEVSHDLNVGINLDPTTPAGTYSIEVSAEDKNENTSSASVVVIIE